VLRFPDYRRSSRRPGRALMLLRGTCSLPHMKKPRPGRGQLTGKERAPPGGRAHSDAIAGFPPRLRSIATLQEALQDPVMHPDLLSPTHFGLA
jgi:hypothetical protein